MIKCSFSGGEQKVPPRSTRSFLPAVGESSNDLFDLQLGVSLEIGNFCTLSALFNQSWCVRD
ncbi:hypothetical protein EO804_20440 [Salmonella enterica]|nr:hypothetical protein [Salmonella enterica]EBJ1927855.1 hypothetical protein [Salmonella enterica]